MFGNAMTIGMAEFVNLLPFGNSDNARSKAVSVLQKDR
jgi:hypothetical protein